MFEFFFSFEEATLLEKKKKEDSRMFANLIKSLHIHIHTVLTGE